MSQPPLSTNEQEFLRRRRQRNWAIFIALLALVGLFYVVSVARLVRA